jgi:hypothetical protein
VLNDHVTDPPIVPVLRMLVVSVVPEVDVFICIQLSIVPQPVPPPPPPPELTVKFTPLLATPPTVTTTFPVVAPAGTDVTMLVEVQVVVVAAVPLNVTVPEDPKFVPVIVTAVPTGPEVVDRFVMLGEVTPVCG